MIGIKKMLLIVAIFSVAMGFLESSVVIYIREIYYPEGFDFPLVSFDNLILITELLREAATILMLISIALLAAWNFYQQFAIFLYSFGIWDITYYIFLKLLIDWPASIFTWDILFLIPVPWIGPVIAPCLLSLTMITLALIIIYLQEQKYKVKLLWKDWLLLIIGSLVVIGSFTVDYISIICNNTSTREIGTMIDHLQQFVPDKFNWYLFFIGWIFIVTDTYFIYHRSKKSVPGI